MGNPVKIFDHDFTAAETAQLGDVIALPPGTNGVAFHGNFDTTSGGTSVKAYIQTSLDNGATWFDICCFAFTTSDALKAANVTGNTAVTTVATPAEATLTDNTAISGLLGDRLRVKYTSVGTYAGTNLKIFATPHQ